MISGLFSSIFGSFSSILNIWEKVPPAIDYFYMPPQVQMVPDDALLKKNQEKEYYLSIVGLKNLSDKVLSSIRIKLGDGIKHLPKIKASDGVDFHFNKECNEIIFDKLDPDDEIYVFIFLLNEEFGNFLEPSIIIENRKLTRGMRIVGDFKSNPKDYVLLALSKLIFIIWVPVVVFTLYTMYKNSDLNPRYRAVTEAIRGLDGCIPTGYPNEEMDEFLPRHQFGNEYLFYLNNVDSMQELKRKEYIVICEKRKK